MTKYRNRGIQTPRVEPLLSTEELKKVFEEIRNNRYSIKEYLKDKKDYEEYQKGQLEMKTKEKYAEMKIYDSLLALGLSFEDIGTFFYKELILEIARSLDYKNVYGKQLCDEEVMKEMLNNRYSSIYLEVAKINLEVSCDTFHSEIKKAMSKANPQESDKDLVVEIFTGHEDAVSYQEQALYIGRYIQNKYLGKDQVMQFAMA